jgi:hypothetical protein
MDLTTNGVVITDAIKYVQGKMDHLNTAEKQLLKDIKEDKEKEQISEESSEKKELEPEEHKTHNGIFYSPT